VRRFVFKNFDMDSQQFEESKVESPTNFRKILDGIQED